MEGGRGKGDWLVKIKRANIERILVCHKIYTIYYKGLHLDNYWNVMEGGRGKGDWSVTIKRANIERVLVYHKIYTIYYTGLHLENSLREGT